MHTRRLLLREFRRSDVEELHRRRRRSSGQGVRKASVDADTADVGFELDTRHWGRGYATEGMARLVAFAFGEVGLAQLTARAVGSNRRSHAVLQRLGFERVETIPPGLGKDGAHWPERYEFRLRAPET